MNADIDYILLVVSETILYSVTSGLLEHPLEMEKNTIAWYFGKLNVVAVIRALWQPSEELIISSMPEDRNSGRNATNCWMPLTWGPKPTFK